LIQIFQLFFELRADFSSDLQRNSNWTNKITN